MCRSPVPHRGMLQATLLALSAALATASVALFVVAVSLVA